MLELEIRDEKPDDAAAIEAVPVAAFASAAHTAGTEQFIVAALRRTSALAVSLVAEAGHQIVGYVAVSPVTLSDGTSGWYGLGPISVLPENQRQGVGSRLMIEAMQRLREVGAAGCVLVGDPTYYTRFGFHNEPALTYPEVPAQYFLVLPFVASVPRAVVTFHRAFGVKE